MSQSVEKTSRGLESVSPTFIRWIRNYHRRMNSLLLKRYELEELIYILRREGYEWAEFRANEHRTQLIKVEQHIAYLKDELASKLLAEELEWDNRFYDEDLYALLHPEINE